MDLSLCGDKSIILGHPSYVWRRGQDRRLNLIRSSYRWRTGEFSMLAVVLACTSRSFARFSSEVHGVDLDEEKVEEARRRLPNISIAPAEELPIKIRAST